MKRIFDVIASSIGFVLVLPVLAIACCAIKCSSPGPAVFKQQRVGRYFRPFTIYKLRTMLLDTSCAGGLLTSEGDQRITRVGAVLRHWKVDELPQLVNVVKGDMSLVGPRPEIPQYVEMFRDDFAEILRVRPGLTDPASLEYADESAVLARANDPTETYISNVLPHKIRLAKQYIRRATVFSDLSLIFKTLARIAQ